MYDASAASTTPSPTIAARTSRPATTPWQIDVGEGGIPDVRIVGVTFLDGDAASRFQPFERGDTDMEEIVLLADDTLLVSSERDRANRPWVRRFSLDGTMLGEIAIPERFMPAAEPPDGRPRVTRASSPTRDSRG